MRTKITPNELELQVYSSSQIVRRVINGYYGRHKPADKEEVTKPDYPFTADNIPNWVYESREVGELK